MTSLTRTPRNTVKRAKQRASYEREALYAVIDSTLLCHVGIVQEQSPVVIPTLCWRWGDELCIHGSNGSRLLQVAQQHGCCITVTQLDGLVMARSAFHHSVNYRSAVVFGQMRKLSCDTDKDAALKVLFEHWWPQRWDALRPMSEQERNATTVLAMPLEEASVKVREGGPNDDAEDMQQRVWAGQLPLATGYKAPIADVDNIVDELPAYLGSKARVMA